jgi:hypothetical protein
MDANLLTLEEFPQRGTFARYTTPRKGLLAGLPDGLQLAAGPVTSLEHRRTVSGRQ